MKTFKTEIRPHPNSNNKIVKKNCLDKDEIHELKDKINETKGILNRCAEEPSATGGKNNIFVIEKCRLDLQFCYTDEEGIRHSNFQLQLNNKHRKPGESTTIAHVDIMHDYKSDNGYNTYQLLEPADLSTLAYDFYKALKYSLNNHISYQIRAYFEEIEE